MKEAMLSLVTYMPNCDMYFWIPEQNGENSCCVEICQKQFRVELLTELGERSDLGSEIWIVIHIMFVEIPLLFLFI